jgi:hypothetical protein
LGKITQVPDGLRKSRDAFVSFFPKLQNSIDCGEAVSITVVAARQLAELERYEPEVKWGRLASRVKACEKDE